jgi:hypothetical protein
MMLFAQAVSLLDLTVINHSISPNFRAPKAITDVFIRYKVFQIQLAPAMQTESAKQVLEGVGLVFSVGPQLS